MGNSTAWNYLGGVILICILAGAGYYILYADNGNNDSSELTITVDSTHYVPSVNSTDFKLYIDDVEIQSWTMGVSGQKVIKYNYDMPEGEDAKTITIKATCTCKLGTKVVTSELLVEKGQKYNVTLEV